MRALVAYSSSSTHVQTTLDYLLYFQKYSGFFTRYVHVTHDAKLDIDFAAFDCVFHSYCARLCFEGYVGESYRTKLRAFRGVKVLAVQDEYDHTDTLKSAIKDLAFDIVLTCVPQASLEYVYPKAEFPDVTFITVFTGYVPDDFEQGRPPPPPIGERPIAVGYRGRDIGGRYGQLGFDKFEIGRRMKEICDGRGIVSDIAMDEVSRIYGMAWFDYLGRCRSMLGSESGSNVFDFDGSIDRKFKEMTAANGGNNPSYAEFLPFVAARDNEIAMGQISPRVFECAIMRTPMVLYRGWYSGAIAPDTHYIPLEKDFTNVDEVLRRLDDIPALEAMAERAYQQLVGSGRFNYQTFFGMVGDAIRARLTPSRRAVHELTEWAGAGFMMTVDGAVEKASARPDLGDAFKARISASSIKVFELEVRRLEGEFARILLSCTRELERLEQAVDHLTRDCVARHGPEIARDMLPEARTRSPQFTAHVDALRREDEAWSLACREHRAAITSTECAGGCAASRVIVAADSIEGRMKSLGRRFIDFDATYRKDYDRLQGALRHIQGTLLRAYLDKVRRGEAVARSSLMLTRLLANSGICMVRSNVRKVARLVRRSLVAAAVGLSRNPVVSRAIIDAETRHPRIHHQFMLVRERLARMLDVR